MPGFEVGAVLGIVAVLVIVVFAVFSRLKIASPDQALIVVTKKKSDDGSGLTTSTKIVTGGRVLVLPFVQKAYTLSLQSHQLDMSTTAQTSNGITLIVDAVAMIKVDGKEEMIRAAAQRFLSDQSKIQTSTNAVLSGALRSVIGGLDVTAIIRDRAAVASAVLEAVSEALSKQGLALDTLQIQEIRDTEGYIHNIGRPEAARVKQEADIADIRTEQASKEAKIVSDKVVMERTRELNIRTAEIQKETDEAMAAAEAAKPRETAIQKLKIVEAQQQTAVQETALREAQLNAEVRKVADANAYQVETAATAAANATVSSAKASAAAVEAAGKAEATAIEAKGRAEAVVILERAKALETQSQAVLAQDLIARLPELMGTMAAAYSGIDNLTIVSADGPSKITGDMIGNVKGVMEMTKDVVGIDLASLLTGAVTGRATGNAIGNSFNNEANPTVSNIGKD